LVSGEEFYDKGGEEEVKDGDVLNQGQEEAKSDMLKIFKEVEIFSK